MTETEERGELLSKLFKIKENIDYISEEDILLQSTSDYKKIDDLLKNDGYSEEFNRSMKKLETFKNKKRSKSI
jgi:hypothetical protein